MHNGRATSYGFVCVVGHLRSARRTAAPRSVQHHTGGTGVRCVRSGASRRNRERAQQLNGIRPHRFHGDDEGRYHIRRDTGRNVPGQGRGDGLPLRNHQGAELQVGRTVVRDFRLEVGPGAETVVVAAEYPLIERASSAVGHVVTAQTVQEMPLNGRHFTDLGLLVPGSVAPSQTGFSTTPIRGVGALAINTAGNREEAVGFVVNGMTTNNLTFGSLSVPAPDREHPGVQGQQLGVQRRARARLRARSSASSRGRAPTPSAASCSGSFGTTRSTPATTSSSIRPSRIRSERHQFGGSFGGPLVRGRTFFFAAYEGFRQRQGLDMNSLVLSDEQRAAVTDPVIRRLIELIPRANFVDTGGTPRFVGSGEAIVDTDRWSIDLQQNLGANGRLHFFYGRQ